MTTIRFLGTWAALCLACARPDGKPLAGAEPLAAESGSGGGDAHLLVSLELSGAALRVVDARRVPGALPVLRGEAPGRWVVEVRSSEGALLHAVRMAAPDELRGEFPLADGGMEVHHLRRDRAAFAVRLPILPGAAELRVVAPDAAPGARRIAGRVAFPEVDR